MMCPKCNKEAEAIEIYDKLNDIDAISVNCAHCGYEAVYYPVFVTNIGAIHEDNKIG